MIVQKLAAGRESNTHKLALAGARIILKRRLTAGRQQYLFEAYVCRRLAELGVQTPKILYANNHVLLMRAFLGRELDDQPWLYDNKSLFAAIGQQLALSRNLTFTGFGPALRQQSEWCGQYATWQDYLRQVGTLFAVPAVQQCGLTAAELQTLQAYWDAIIPMIDVRRGALVHGDFSLGAIFVRDGVLEGLIDFGDALVGDPLLDVAYFRFKEIDKPYGQQLYSSLLGAYTAAAKITLRPAFEQTITAYMIYWALVRIAGCSDERVRQKFVAKARCIVPIM